MIVPCESGRHWDQLVLSLNLSSEWFDVEVFSDRIGEPDVNETWTLTGEDPCISQVEMHSHEATPKEDEETEEKDQGAPNDSAALDYHLTIFTYRERLEVESSQPSFGYEEFFGALADAISDEAPSVSCLSSCRMIFSGEPRWQLPILAEPPELQEVDSGLGRVSLVGVTLEFEESKIGLLRTALESGLREGESRLRILYRFRQTAADLIDLFGVALDKAEDFASFFISGSPEEDEEE